MKSEKAGSMLGGLDLEWGDVTWFWCNRFGWRWDACQWLFRAHYGSKLNQWF